MSYNKLYVEMSRKLIEDGFNQDGEFDLLHCLARQAGQVVTRGQILDEVWGQDAEITENAVDVYVGYLRRYLSPHERAPELSTVRGVGFLLRHQTKA